MEGDLVILDQMRSTLVQFDVGFEALPSIGTPNLTPEAKPLSQPVALAVKRDTNNQGRL